MSRTLARAAWAVLVCTLFFAIPLRLAAQGYGSINGTVTDPSGAVVAGVTVTATQASTGLALKTTASATGTYVFPSLAPSTYNVSAHSPGFQAFRETDVHVRADNAITVDITLKPGGAQESVEVTAQSVQVDVTTGTQSQVITTTQMNALPLNGRNAAQLTEEVAGVSLAPPAQADQGNTKTFPVVIAVSTNGTFVGQTNYMLDGGNNVDEYTNVNAPFPMPDALQEFSIETNNYGAQYGQNAGGVVNIITKSGTSKYHGDLFEYVRNSDLNAANYFSYNSSTHTKLPDQLKRNQFGGTIGGPLQIPHLLRNSKGFFFLGYQRTIDHEAASTSSSILPTIAEAGANSSGQSPGSNNLVFPNCVSDPLMPSAILTPTISGCAAGTSNVWSNSALNSVTANFLKYIPPLTTSGSILYQVPNLYGFAEITARVDQELTPKDKLELRYFSDAYHLQGVENLTNILTLADQAQNNYYNSLIGETHTFSNHIVNNLIFSYQLENDSRGPVSSSVSMGDLGVNIWQPAFKQINQVEVSPNFFNLSVNPQAFFQRANYTLIDDVHFVLGRHNIDAGYHGEISKIDITNDFEQPGQFFFNSNVTNNGMASFLFGYLYEFVQASGQFFAPRGHFNGLYIQDTWKATRKLSLNYGVRWEPFIPWHESKGRMGSFFPSLWASNTHSAVYPLAPAGMQFAGDSGFNPNGVASSFGHFMPRIGFAYDVFGNGKTSVRGGGGMFYDSRINSTLFNIYSNSVPFVASVAIFSSPASGSTPAVNMTFNNPYGTSGVANPFPAPQPPPNTFPISSSNNWLTYDPYRGFQDPLDYAWNLAVQQQLASSLTFQLAYVATHGSHQWQDLELNPEVNGTRIFDPAGCSTTNSCYPNYITAANTGGNSGFNSMQVSLEQRLRYGLNILFNYTWSKALNDMPWNQAATSIASANSFVLPITVPNFKALDYGPADFDHRNITALSYVYTIPKFLNDSPAVVRYIVNGWGTSGIFQYRSGDPLTIWSSSSNNSNSGQNRDRAVWSGTSPYGGTACTTTVNCRSFLNPASFSANPKGTFGNVVKGAFIGPHYVNWDVSLTRRFPITERTYLSFEADYFNVLNHTNLGDPNTTLGSTFGEITSTSPQNWAGTAPQNDPRIAQLSLKLLF